MSVPCISLACLVLLAWSILFIFYAYGIWRNDSQHNDTQHNDTHQNVLICDIEHYDIAK